MNPASCLLGATTVAGLPSEDVVVLSSGTLWHVPWELMMLGPFVSCGLLDGEVIRHVTVPAMVASATRRSSSHDAVLIASDYPKLPVFAGEMPLLAAAVLVAKTGWDLAVVMDNEPRLITARSVYRALVGHRATNSGPASLIRSSSPMASASARAHP
jgi:hypothetical protein